MTKQDLVNLIAAGNNWGLSKKATEEVVDAVFDSIRKAIKKDRRFRYPGFGTFEIRSRKARTGRNPRTGDTIKIKASKTVGFRPAKNLKTKI